MDISYLKLKVCNAAKTQDPGVVYVYAHLFIHPSIYRDLTC